MQATQAQFTELFHKHFNYFHIINAKEKVVLYSKIITGKIPYQIKNRKGVGL